MNAGRKHLLSAVRQDQLRLRVGRKRDPVDYLLIPPFPCTGYLTEGSHRTCLCPLQGPAGCGRDKEFVFTPDPDAAHRVKQKTACCAQ